MGDMHTLLKHSFQMFDVRLLFPRNMEDHTLCKQRPSLSLVLVVSSFHDFNAMADFNSNRKIEYELMSKW
jgi:hypothetical protein